MSQDRAKIAPIERKLEGNAAYEEALDELLDTAAQTVKIFDRQLTAAFNTPRRFEAMRRLLLANRNHRIQIVLHETTNLVRDCPRLIILLRQFTHGITIRQTIPTARNVYDPFAVADAGGHIHRFHYNNIRGLALYGDTATTHALLQRFAALHEASSPASLGIQAARL
jgi:hypothetical protein